MFLIPISGKANTRQCPIMTHVIEITRIPFSDVIALSATSVLITALVFLIKEKQRKNSCSDDPPKAREKHLTLFSQ